jgi:chemotaxis signal transduction protein
MTQRFLQIHVDERELCVPIDSIANIAEHDITSPPPLSQDCVGGLAIQGDELFVVVSLTRADRTARARRRSKCLRIKSSSKSAAWGLLVDGVGRIVELEPTRDAIDDPSIPRGWLSGARDASGAKASIVVLDAVQRTLEGAAQPKSLIA